VRDKEKARMVEDYHFGRITVRGKSYASDVIIYPDRVDSPWWRREGHSLCLEDLRAVLAARPEVLVVGTGAYGLMQIQEEVKEHLSKVGIELQAAATAEACTLYNQLGATRKTVAALHLTC
jgi:hypothetical protein